MSGSQWKGRKDYLRWYYNSAGPPFLLSRSLMPERHCRYLFGVAFAELRQGKSRLRTLWLITEELFRYRMPRTFLQLFPVVRQVRYSDGDSDSRFHSDGDNI